MDPDKHPNFESSISISNDSAMRGMPLKTSFRGAKVSSVMTTMTTSDSNLVPSFTTTHRSQSTLSMKSDDFQHFCDWYPDLFGIDEDVLPPTEESGEEEEEEDVKMKKPSQVISPTLLQDLRVESKADYTDEELIRLWKTGKEPKYGRRARPQPMLKKDDGTSFDCICNIDREFQRHHVSHFGGGIKKEGEEFRVPHFAEYWQGLRDAEIAREEDSWLNFEAFQLPPIEGEESIPYVRPRPQIAGTGIRAIREFRLKMLRSMRPLTLREIRRYRMPYAEAIILELQEDGYRTSANFLKNLIIAEYRLDRYRDPCPTLRGSKTKIHRLVKALKECERRARRKQCYKQAMIFCKLGKYFNDDQPTWWWLAERLYARAVDASSQCIIDGGKSEAICRYVFGTFLLDYMGKVNAAQVHLTRARELSMGQNWTANSILETKQEPIHKETCNYLCRALIATGRELRLNGKADLGLPLIHKSHKLCEESHTMRKDIEMETLFEMGMIYQEIGMLDWAKNAFRKFIEIATSENYVQRICDGYLELAICYRCEGNLERCHENLVTYLRIAKEYQNENMTAYGNRYLGEFHLNNGNAEIAAEFLDRSFNSFYQQTQDLNKAFAEWGLEEFTLPKDLELTRVLTGLALGEVMTRPICKLILAAGDPRCEMDTLILLKWKNAHEKLFEVHPPSLHSAQDSTDEEAEPETEGDNDISESTMSLTVEDPIKEAEERIDKH